MRCYGCSACPCLWVKTWSGNFLEPSLRSELAQPMCRAAYSRTEETRELGMTKVADITASYARCKLLKDSHGLWRPLTK
jgi:hypothetical protein